MNAPPARDTSRPPRFARRRPVRPGAQFIDGRLRAGSAGPPIDVIDPSNGTVVATITLAGPADVELAVAAARAAYPEWSCATPGERSAALARFARLLERRAEEIAQLESRQAGKPIWLIRNSTFPARSTTSPSSPCGP